MQIETVKVAAKVSEDNPLGYVVINKCDMTDSDVLFSDEIDKAPAKQDKKAFK